MAKEAYYFSHDSNARHDPKITAMRSVYGSEGYGWFWMLVEMMRDADGFMLDMQGKYTINAYAMQMQANCSTLERFVHDCIHEFKLFSSNGSHFWSNSLLKRMEKRDQIREKRRAAANVKWDKERENQGFPPRVDANASYDDAFAMQGKERKGNIKELHLAQFNEFWTAYPKKQGRASAEKKWLVFCSNGEIDIEQVMQGTKAYMAYIASERGRGFDRQYMDGSTFVNQKRWKDDWTVQQQRYRDGNKNVIHLPEVQVSDEERRHLADVARKQAERNGISPAVNE